MRVGGNGIVALSSVSGYEKPPMENHIETLALPPALLGKLKDSFVYFVQFGPLGPLITHKAIEGKCPELHQVETK